MIQKSYSVTEAARVLGVSAPTVKRMSADGKLDSFRTPGGHLRITAESVERLREGGSKEVRQHREPSTVLKNRQEHVEELNLEALELRAQRELAKLRRETAEEAQRDRQEVLRQVREQRREEERLRLERERREQERENAELARQEAAALCVWQDGWLKRALASLPKNCPKEYHGRVCREVQEALEGLDPDGADSFVQELVDAAVEQALAPWRREKAVQDAITAGEHCLPVWARSLDWGFGVPTPTEWQIKVQRLAKEKIAQLGEDPSREEIRAAAVEAGQAVAREYEATEAVAERQRREESARRGRELKLQLGLAHVSSYLRQLEEDQEFDFEDRDRLKRKLEKLIRPELLQEIESDPDLDLQDVEDLVEDLVDEALPEFIEED